MKSRVACVVCAFLLLSFSQSAYAQSAVNITNIVSLGDGDLGIEGAAISPDGKLVIAYGEESAVFAMNSTSPGEYSEIYWNESDALVDAGLHPNGQTAFIVGENGAILRYIREMNSVEEAADELYFGQTDLRAISWKDDGTWAYVGGEDGWVWRVRGIDGGGSEVIPLEGRGDSDVNGISCLSGAKVCVIGSSVDGIGVIDGEHAIHWIGGVGYPWIDVVCPTGSAYECVAISTDRTIGIVSVNVYEPEKSKVYENDIVKLQSIDGKFNGIEIQSDGRSLISMAPFEIIEHDLDNRVSFPWLENEDVVEFDPLISNDRVVSTWSTGFGTGWIVTSTGKVMDFSPKEGEERGGVLTIWIGIIVFGGAALLTFSLIASSSKTLSNWVSIAIGSEEEKVRAKRERRRKGRRK